MPWVSESYNAISYRNVDLLEKHKLSDSFNILSCHLWHGLVTTGSESPRVQVSKEVQLDGSRLLRLLRCFSFRFSYHVCWSLFEDIDEESCEELCQQNNGNNAATSSIFIYNITIPYQSLTNIKAGEYFCGFCETNAHCIELVGEWYYTYVAYYEMTCKFRTRCRFQRGLWEHRSLHAT